MNEQTHPTQETLPNETPKQEINQNPNAEQTKPEENRTPSGQEVNGQIDFSQMYDMLKERDETIKTLKTEVADLKKSNTNLLLKVNASATPDAQIKTPYEKFVDSMVAR